MVVKPGFELGFTKSKIVLFWNVGSCNGSFINSDFVLQLYGISSVCVVGCISLSL